MKFCKSFVKLFQYNRINYMIKYSKYTKSQLLQLCNINVYVLFALFLVF